MGTQVTFAEALIDTGAMHTMLPEDAAENIGIDLSTSQTVTISTANGALDVRYDLVDLELQGIACNQVGVYFGPGGSLDLIGRSTIYRACESLGLTDAEWLRKSHQ
jgi:predicted aspartyl protease